MEQKNMTEKILLAVACCLVAGIVLFNAFSAPVSPVLGVVYQNQDEPASSRSVEDYYAALASEEEVPSSNEDGEAGADYSDLWEDPPAETPQSEVSQSPPSSSKPDQTSSSKPSSSASSSTSNSSSSKVPAVVNINTATAAQLASALPGVGEVKANAIVAYRNANGPFRSVDELINVKGIGEATLEKLRPYATVG